MPELKITFIQAPKNLAKDITEKFLLKQEQSGKALQKHVGNIKSFAEPKKD